MLGDARQHPGPDLVAIVEREHVVRPPVASEGFMGTGLALDAPANAEERGEHTSGAGGRPGCHERTPLWKELGGAEGNADEVGTGLAMLEAVGEDAEGKRLGVGNRFVARCPVGEDALEVGDLGDPPAILFAIDFESEMHAGLERWAPSGSNCACAASI